MEIADPLELERYKFVVDRQKYFTELAREAFGSYVKLFSALAGGGITLVSAGNKLELSAELLRHLIVALVYLAAILAFAASAQIVFCLARWRGYRKAE